MSNVNHSRRKWLSLGGVVIGATMLPNSVLAISSTPAPRLLRLRNINTGEVFNSEVGLGRELSSSALHKLNWFLRDKYTSQVHPMDPQLFSKLYDIQSNLGLRNTEIQIICGYRCPSTNAKMHRRSRGVASNSYHVKGQAIDFRIDGVSLAKVKTAAQSLNNGGVGYYPVSNFVHIDTGPVRTWSGS
ncbi:YcbK family protein [Mannheimia massilioguelmaensis]|uniref:YcbK family protein n=1 Tax=Mannheimia massilioguelmaensis TaxID=1604354 RepID=UPI0005C8BC00|nr:YcbK family protein [Mannheimia massilioguelmaensis]